MKLEGVKVGDVLAVKHRAFNQYRTYIVDRITARLAVARIDPDDARITVSFRLKDGLMLGSGDRFYGHKYAGPLTNAIRAEIAHRARAEEVRDAAQHANYFGLSDAALNQILALLSPKGETK